MKRNAETFLWPLAVVGLTVLFFLPVLQGEFLNWDDDGLFVENPYFRGLSPKHWQWMCTTFWFGHWQPLSWLSYALDYKVWGMNPHGWHATNLLLHTVNAVLVYWLCLDFGRRTHPALAGTPPKEGSFKDFHHGKAGRNEMTGEADFSNPLHGRGARQGGVGFLLQSPPLAEIPKGGFLESPPSEGCPKGGVGYYAAAALAALFWAVHPLRVEAVAWLATRGYLLCTTFCLLTVLFYLRAMKQKQYPLATLLCFALATFTKGIGMMLPPVLLLIDWLGRDVWGYGSRGVWEWRRKRLTEKIPFFALSLLTGITAFLAKKNSGGMAPVELYGPVERIGQALYGILFYLRKTIFPRQLSPLYEKHPELWQVLAALLFLTAAGIFLFLFRRKLRPIIGAAAAFLLLIFPMLGITQSGSQMFADRFTYFTSIPFSILLTAGLIRLTGLKRIVCGALAVLVFIFGLQTFIYSQFWGSSLPLWDYAVRTDRNSGQVHSNKGLSLIDLHRYEEALECFNRAVKLDPFNAILRHNRALALAQMGRYKESLAEWAIALSFSGNSNQSIRKMKLARGWVFGKIGNLEAAEKDYSSVADDLTTDPIRRSGALQLRAALFIQTGRPERAEADLMEMLKLPDAGNVYHEKARFVLNRLKKVPGE